MTNDAGECVVERRQVYGRTVWMVLRWERVLARCDRAEDAQTIARLVNAEGGQP